MKKGKKNVNKNGKKENLNEKSEIKSEKRKELKERRKELSVTKIAKKKKMVIAKNFPIAGEVVHENEKIILVDEIAAIVVREIAEEDEVLARAGVQVEVKKTESDGEGTTAEMLARKSTNQSPRTTEANQIQKKRLARKERKSK
jgi:hypothetical protein